MDLSLSGSPEPVSASTAGEPAQNRAGAQTLAHTSACAPSNGADSPNCGLVRESALYRLPCRASATKACDVSRSAGPARVKSLAYWQMAL